MNEERLIMIITAAIIIIQIIVFARTVWKIIRFKKIFHPISYFKTHTVHIPADEIQSAKPGATLHNQPANKGDIEIIQIKTIVQNGKILGRILESLNSYLIRNKGAVSDFDLMKDIVERNCGAEDEDVNTSLSVPLYLGLMGTMIGIVVGLYFVTADSLTSDTPIASIGGLIGGVRIAMLSSFAGLLCTTIGQGGLYKRIKAQVERKKHEFYTFLQTELLPVLHQNVNPAIDKLQRNLTKFNETFSENTKEFGSLLGAVNTSFNDHAKDHATFQQLIKEINIEQIAGANIKVLQELKGSIGELKGSIGEIGKFNDYLNQINSFIANAEKLNVSLLAQLERTSSVETIVGSIETLVIRIEKITTESATLTEFLNSHFAELNEHSTLVNKAINKHSQQITHAIINVDNNMQNNLQQGVESFEQFTNTYIQTLTEVINTVEHQLEEGVESFENFTQERIAKLSEFVSKEEEKLHTRLEETSGLLEELKNLSNVKESMKNMETLSGAQKALTEMQNTKLDNLTNSIDKLVDVLKTQADNSVEKDAPAPDNKNEVKISRRFLWSAVITGSIIIGLTVSATVVALKYFMF